MKYVSELKTKKEMEKRLFLYDKLIGRIDKNYWELEKGSPKRLWIDDNWTDILDLLGDHFMEIVDEGGWNTDQRTLQEIVNDDLDELIRCNDWSVRDVRDRGEDLIQDLHTKNIGTLKEIGRCLENWVDENWDELN